MFCFPNECDECVADPSAILIDIIHRYIDVHCNHFTSTTTITNTLLFTALDTYCLNGYLSLILLLIYLHIKSNITIITKYFTNFGEMQKCTRTFNT